MADLQRTVYPRKWLSVSCRASAGQGKFAGQRPTFYHCATQPVYILQTLYPTEVTHPWVNKGKGKGLDTCYSATYISHPNPQKAHPLVTTRHLSHKWLKSVQGFDLGGVARKKYNQDRTEQHKSHKSVIFHIFGGKFPVKILQ